MTYVLLVVDIDNKPCYLQGTIAEINVELRTLWAKDEIDRDNWDFSSWELLSIEDDRLTPVERVQCISIPQFDVI